MSRIDTLRGILDQDPANSRIRYMLAMELLNTGDPEAAVSEFAGLLDRDADYGAAYFHGGQTLEKLGRKAEARALYQRGIDATSRTGDSHTRGELQGALDMLA
jgi:tetratricopeptide (TPR) repeat protein